MFLGLALDLLAAALSLLVLISAQSLQISCWFWEYPNVSLETSSLLKLPLSLCYLHPVTLIHSAPSLEAPLRSRERSDLPPREPLKSQQHGELSSFTPHFPPLPAISPPCLTWHTVGLTWHSACSAAFAPTALVMTTCTLFPSNADRAHSPAAVCLPTCRPTCLFPPQAVGCRGWFMRGLHLS